ncbi:MAG: GDSL-type esterase/lipase family protein [Peptococcaceae bacterium]
MSAIVNGLSSSAPIPVYGKVTVYNRAVSLVFEGSEDEDVMMELADLLQERGVDAVMFLSGAEAMEHPAVVRYVADAGVEIGNYTLSAEKSMQENKATKNARQFYLTQQAIFTAGMITPSYLRCNGTEYSEEILKLAGLAGLKAAVEPSVYLNHRSFANEEQAKNYVRSISRGSIVSIKLGQELDETEINTKPAQEAEPADDLKPTVEEEISSESVQNDVDIVDLTHWVLDAMELENLEVVPLQNLQDAAAQGLPEQEVSQELLEKLDVSLYPNLTTKEPFGLQESAGVPGSYFDKTVFVGDSIMAGIQNYVENQRKKDPGYFGTAQFLAAGGLSVRNALWKVSDESRHPSYKGERMLIEDAIGRMDVEKVYIMLGMNDILLSDVDTYLANYQTLIQLILEQSPNVKIYVMSITPGTAKEGLRPSNRQIFEYTLALVGFCARYGYEYVDVSSAIRLGDGSLPLEMCSDPDGMGFHFTEEACAVWARYIYTHTV